MYTLCCHWKPVWGIYLLTVCCFDHTHTHTLTHTHSLNPALLLRSNSTLLDKPLAQINVCVKWSSTLGASTEQFFIHQHQSVVANSEQKWKVLQSRIQGLSFKCGNKEAHVSTKSLHEWDKYVTVSPLQKSCWLNYFSMETVKESRILDTSAAHKCPYSLLYHSGNRPLQSILEICVSLDLFAPQGSM